MEQSLLKKTSNTLDPYPRPCRKELSNHICNQNIQAPSSSYVQQDVPNKYHFNPLIRKHYTIDSLDEEIKSLLHEKLVWQVVKGRPCDSIQFHRKQLIKEMADWLNVLDDSEDLCTNDNGSFRDELISLLATASKQNIKDIPLDKSEWIKLLNQWVKANSSGQVISSREIYRILAVDGFQGFKPKYLKLYLSGVLLPLRTEFESHVCGVRNMYKHFEHCEKISSLTGTDSACVVFLVLIEWYGNQMKHDAMLDDQVMFHVKQAKLWAQRYLQQNGEYFKDVKNVDENVLRTLGEIYSKHFQDGESWKAIGRELLTSLRNENIK